MKIDGNTIRLTGQLGVPELKEVQDGLRGMVKAGHETITVDLINVDYMSSSYIGLVVGVASEMDAKGNKLTVRAQGQVMRLLQLAGIDKVINVEGHEGWAPPA